MNTEQGEATDAQIDRRCDQLFVATLSLCVLVLSVILAVKY